MKNYEIVSIDSTEYDVIIYSESRIAPFENIKDIEDDLKKMTLKKKRVLFDMILCRGNNADRFIKCDFDEKLLKNTMEVVSLSKKDVLRKISVGYLSKEKDKIENSILTSIQKKMIIKGIGI